MREEVEALEHHADGGARCGDVALGHADALVAVNAIADRLPIDRDRATLVLFEQVDAAQQRRLARAARSDNHNDLARCDGQ
jgi:hypothetical protein